MRDLNRERVDKFIDDTIAHCERMHQAYANLWMKVEVEDPKYHEHWGKLTAYRRIRQKMKSIKRDLGK